MLDADPNLHIYILIGSVFLLAAVLLVTFLWSFRKSAGSGRDIQGDLANMMILLQTMRDMLDQQKELARQLNASVDRKVAMIRHVVKAAADAHDELCQAQRALAEQLRRTRAQINELHNRASRPHETTVSQDVDQQRDTPRKPTQPIDIPIPEPAAHTNVPRAATSSDSDEDEGDLVDHWVGLEVAAPEPEPATEQDPEPVGESPDEAHAARDAFRMLLNMASNQTPVPQAPEDIPARAHQGNGHEDRMAANRALIYEYSDAGMSVSDIARELGMGKGEVRLILGLRKEEERKV